MKKSNKSLLRILLLISAVCISGLETQADCQNPISLAGEWSIAYSGITSVIHLPRTMDDAGLGEKVEFPAIKAQDIVSKKDYQTWSRRYRFYGEAVYHREITVPESWKGKRVSVFLERCFWQSKLVVDGKPVGTQSSLCTPHIYDLGMMEPGRHTLELTIDNRHLYDLGKDWAHGVSEQTQPNWNGVIGRIELIAREPADLLDLQVFPNVDGRSITVKARLDNGPPVSLVWRVKSREGRMITKGVISVKGNETEWQIDLGTKARLWDEFHPNLYQLEVAVNAKATPMVTRFGLRTWGVADKQFQLNGRPIYLRGTVENLVFPLTGYPAMDKEAWRKIIRTCKEWGLNTMRFHSWCPPEAAFAGFPTESYMNWQWFDVMEDARIMDLDELSPELKPLLQFIGNFESDQRVAGLLEVRVGKGRLLITTLNLTDNLERRPAASLLRRSLLDYLANPAPENLQDFTLQKLNGWLVNSDIWWK